MVMDIQTNSKKYFQLILAIGLLLFLFAMTSCGGSKATSKSTETSQASVPVNKVSSNIPAMDAFLDAFEEATLAHNSVSILDFLNKGYKKDQLDGFCNKNTDSFLNKFYSNNQVENGKPLIPYKSITKITRVKFYFQNNYQLVTYKIEAGNKQVEIQLTVFSQLEKGELKFSLYGPVG